MTNTHPELVALVGANTYQRGLQYSTLHHVAEFEHDEASSEIAGIVIGGQGLVYQTVVTYSASIHGTVTSLDGECSCPVALDCKHSVALLLTALAAADPHPQYSFAALSNRAGQRTHPPLPEWERALQRLTTSSEAAAATESLGLAFEFHPPVAVPKPAAGPPALRYQHRPAHFSGNSLTQPGTSGVQIRPVRRGKNGTWVRTGISWSGIDRLYQYPAEHARILQAIAKVQLAHEPYLYRVNTAWISLSALNNPAIWELLAEADEAGIPFVGMTPKDCQVLVADTRASVALHARRNADQIILECAIDLDGSRVASDSVVMMGNPPLGLAFRKPGTNQVVLARFERRVDSTLRELFDLGAIHIPAVDEARFLDSYLPRLTERHRIESVDGSFEVPEVQPPILVMTIAPQDDHVAAVTWEWEYRIGSAVRRLSVWPSVGERGSRDRDTENRIRQQVADVLEQIPGLASRTVLGRGPEPHAVTTGPATIRLITEIVPKLEQIDGVAVAFTEPFPDFTELSEAPLVTFSGDSDDDPDWFDLAVSIHIGGREVPFEGVFRALAAGEELMILDDGCYFSLIRDELIDLHRLIDEAKLLQERRGQLRISRYQLSWFEELERLGVVERQAAAWADRLRSLRNLDDHAAPLPVDLQANLRPYQVDGYRWLDLLRRNGLGGVLADDMGLGKTVQALAMILQARSEDPAGGPFLVVAPTSVTGNWQAEARRFCPTLSTRVITETQLRRGVPLDQAVAGADLVITSYTLFRLEYDSYAALSLGGLILDEAQAVKNHQSKAFQCVKQLPAPFKLAITGTPMENNLMELWAQFSVVAPGLLGHPKQFGEQYRIPIEKEQDQGRLDRLRARIHPLMLRRTKEQVAADLPKKQEQIVEIDLEPAHQTVYQRHLQRERQKVLGLLDDMDGNRFAIFRSLTHLRQLSLDASLVDDEYAKVPSTKIDVLMDMLGDIVPEGHRTLVFSQFTSYLRKIRRRLEQAGIDYCYLDGTTTKRQQVLDSFKKGSAPVFLISLKAGGVGLNLTEADYCILMDPWWNPAVEAQAVDRTHRIGQTRPVFVYRLVAKKTIEEKVMALKESKAKLFSGLMSGTGLGRSAISAEDIRAILG